MTLDTENNQSSIQANSQISCCGPTSNTPPIPAENLTNGQSVDYDPNTRKAWYVIRVTQNRAKKVYDELLALNIEDAELYLPHTPHEAVHLDDGVPVATHIDIPISTGFIFVHSTRNKYREVLSYSTRIKGLTPYYDHFHEFENGRNDYLIIPESQFNSFKRICEANDERKLINQKDMPTYLAGKHVKVLTGIFAGVEGTLLRWQGLRRVFVDLGPLGKFGTGFIRSCDFVLID